MDTNILKKLILKNKKSYYDIAEYCSIENNRDFCRKEKLFVCKTALTLAGLKVDFSYPFKYCDIFGEIVEFSQKIGIKKNNKNYLNIEYKPLAKYIINNGSDELKTYIIYNNIKL